MKNPTGLILAAGLGQRLRPITDAIPKVMAEVGGKPILENALEILENNGIRETVIVVGHRKETITERFGNRFKTMGIRYIENEFYGTTNSMYSLWLARSYLKKGALLIEGDVFFEEGIIKKTLKLPDEKTCICVDRFTPFLDGAMITAGDDGRVERIKIVKKGYNRVSWNNYKSIGIWKIAPSYGKELSSWLDYEVKRKNVTVYCDLVVQKNIDKLPLHILDISGMKWAEVDDTEDLRKANDIFRG
jgi:choline kinase